MKRRITALAAAAAMLIGVFGFAGCADTRSAMTINGVEIRAGEYIRAQNIAAYNAASKFMEAYPDIDTFDEGFDFFKQQIEGAAFADWINAEAIRILTDGVAVQFMFDELELDFTADREQELGEMVDAYWNSSHGLNPALGLDTWGDFYTSIGVSKESVAISSRRDAMRNMVFEAYFGEGGTMTPPDEELKEYFADNFLRLRWLEVIIDEDEEDEADAEAEAEAMANSYAQRLNAGEVFVELYDEHQAHVWAELLAGMDEDEADANDETDEPDDVPGDDVNDDVTGDDVIDDTADEEPEPGHEEESEVLEADENIHDFRAKIDDIRMGWDADMFEFVMALEVGTADVYRYEDIFIIFQKMPLLEREDWFEEMKLQLTFEMLGDAMTDLVRERAATLDVALNDAAIKRYRPQRAAPKEVLV